MLFHSKDHIFSLSLLRKSKFFLALLIVIVFFINYPDTIKADEIAGNSYSKYNIILITIDALRADHLSCYGYQRRTSPNIDKLAQEGIIFKSAFSNSNNTLPSLMSIHTSLYPYSHGIFHIGKDILSKKIKTLAEILNNFGYETSYFVKTMDPHTDVNIGFGRGFTYVGDMQFESANNRKRNAKKIFDWIESKRGSKFFVNYHYLDVHTPYLPSLKYKKKFVKKYDGKIIDSLQKLETLQLSIIHNDLKNPQSVIYEILKDKIRFYPEIFDGEFTRAKHIKLMKLANSLSFQEKITFWGRYGLFKIFLSQVNNDSHIDVQYLKDLYDACILEFDETFIGPLIKNLRRLNLYDKTLIILTADHGEEFMEHGDLSHSYNKLYDELIHIPLVIKLPKGHRYVQNSVNDLVQNIDIMPTILDILNIPIPTQAQGISLKMLLQNKENSIKNNYVYACVPTGVSMRSCEYKLVYHFNNSDHEIYDLIKDPRESHNVYKEKPDIANKLEEDFHKWRKNLPSYIDQETDFPPEIDEVTRERIRRTGYW